MIRRRQDDEDWEGAKQRLPWAGPSSRWGEDVNTRLGNLELSINEVVKELQENNRLAGELLSVFQKSKRFGLALIGVMAFLGYSGIVAVIGWIQKHLL